MKNQTSYTILGAAIVVVIIAAISALTPKETDWTLSFDRYKKDPFGTYILGERLKDLFPNNKVLTTRVQYDEKEKQIDDLAEKSDESLLEDKTNYAGKARIGTQFENKQKPIELNYLFLGKDFNLQMAQLHDGDYQQLVDLAANGANIVIAAEQFPDGLQSLLNVSTSPSELSNLHKSIYETKTQKIQSSTIKFVNEKIGKKPLQVENIAVSTRFTNFPIERTKVLAINETECPVLIKIKAGKGAFILSSTPLLFTNYYLMKPDGKEFVANVFSYLPSQDIVWDEYYKFNAPPKDDHRSERVMRYIFSQPPLTWAFWLAIGFTVLYSLFEMKRRQRLIPVVAKPQNYSLEFAETIGQLYYKSQNHKNIAEKQMRSFLEHIRNRYYISTKELDKQFFELLAAKTGLGVAFITDIFEQMKRIRRSEQILENDLIEFSNKIETFYETAK